MARGHKFFEAASGECINFDQVRYFEVNGANVDIFWASPMAAMDRITIAGGQATYDAIVTFLNDLYNREEFVRRLMVAAVNGVISNQESLNAFFFVEARELGPPIDTQLKAKTFQLAEDQADKWEAENP